MRAKSKTKPVPVRFDAKLRKKIRRTAKQLEVSESAMIRFAISQELPNVETLATMLAMK